VVGGAVPTEGAAAAESVVSGRKEFDMSMQQGQSTGKCDCAPPLDGQTKSRARRSLSMSGAHPPVSCGYTYTVFAPVCECVGLRILGKRPKRRQRNDRYEVRYKKSSCLGKAGVY
jgi:hypothetical protein